MFYDCHNNHLEYNSNTTLVKVKLNLQLPTGVYFAYSNTTLVKVKFLWQIGKVTKNWHSNTTLVKVK